MLNELYSMSQSLDRCGLIIPTRHKDLETNPRQDGFILAIDEDGSVASIEFCGKDRMKQILKIKSGENGVSFPGFKIAGPLWSINLINQESIEKLIKLRRDAVSERHNLIEQLLAGATFVYDSLGEGQKHFLRKNLREFPAQVERMLGRCPPEYKILTDLLERLLKSTVSESEFLKSLSAAGLHAAHTGKLSADASVLLQHLLLGKWEKDKQRFVESKTAIILEPFGGTKYPFAITHPKTEEFVNEQMNANMSGKSFAKGGKGAVIKSGTDSLCGDRREIETKFPDPNLPVIGITKLMSMTKDSLCQTRYGLQESATFPVGKETTQVMLDALNFVAGGEREGKTWRGVPNSEGGRDLLIVYLEDAPDASVELADYFALDTDDALFTEAQFEATAEKVCAALEGDPAIRPDSLLRVIVLSSRDKGRKQIALSECFRVKEIFQSAEEWRQAGGNLPTVSVLLPPKKNEKQRVVAPVCPHPATLLKCFNTQWTNGGTNPCPISSCDLGQIYEIFFKQSARSEATAERLLTLALQRNSSLLLALGNRQHGGNWSGFPEGSRFASLISISALAILLFKTGHRKEEFMKQAPFNIGRLFSLADQLHALYCQEVRGGKVPQQLFGNALMSTALQQPITALSLFAQRVLPYQTWANTVSTGDRVGLAKYFIKELGAVSQTLNETDIPSTLNEAERAEMILGYLASSRTTNKESQ